MIPNRWLVAAALVLSGVLPTAPASANPAAAEALFREGRKLLDAGKLEEACAKLAESQRLDPSSGTLGSLAQCHEKQGKSATAWAEYLAASRLATAQGKTPQAQAAKDRAAGLEGKLLYLTIKVPSVVPGLVVKQDGHVVESGSFDTRLPVDPGRTRVTAEASGYHSFSVEIALEPGKPEATVVVPALERSAAGAGASPGAGGAASSAAGGLAPGEQPPPRTSEPPAGPPVAGYVVGAAGVVALGVGTFLGLSSRSKYQDAEKACPLRVSCSPSALESRDSAEARAWGANVGIGLGVASVGVASYLLFFSSPRTASHGAVRLAGGADRTSAGLSLAGGF